MTLLIIEKRKMGLFLKKKYHKIPIKAIGIKRQGIKENKIKDN